MTHEQEDAQMLQMVHDKARELALQEYVLLYRDETVDVHISSTGTTIPFPLHNEAAAIAIVQAMRLQYSASVATAWERSWGHKRKALAALEKLQSAHITIRKVPEVDQAISILRNMLETNT